MMDSATTSPALLGSARILALGVLTLALLVAVGALLPAGVFLGPVIAIAIAVRGLWLDARWAWPVALTTVAYAVLIALQILLLSQGHVTTTG